MADDKRLGRYFLRQLHGLGFALYWRDADETEEDVLETVGPVCELTHCVEEDVNNILTLLNEAVEQKGTTSHIAAFAKSYAKQAQENITVGQTLEKCMGCPNSATHKVEKPGGVMALYCEECYLENENG